MKIFFLSLILSLCSELTAKDLAPGYYVQVGRSYDEIMPFGELTTCPPDLAVRLMKNLQVTSMGHPVDDRIARQLEAHRLLAQNPDLPWAVDDALARDPELVENFSNRQKIINGLARLPAEWSARKLGELTQQEIVFESKIYDLKDTEVLGRLMVLDPGFSPLHRSTPGLAVKTLRLMELPGWLDTLDSQVPMQLHPNSSHGFDSHNHILRVARWIELNEVRIPEMVRKKWGDLAVMNADIGLGADILPLAADGSSPTRSRESKRTTLPGNKPDISQEDNMQLWPVAGVVLLSLISVIGIWLLRRRRLTNAG